jgi:transcriptional regulator with XRE-family HTH domain
LASGVSQEALAHDSGLDRTYLSKIERGRMQPTLNAILKISKALGYKASTLVGLTQRSLDATSSDADARDS